MSKFSHIMKWLKAGLVMVLSYSSLACTQVLFHPQITQFSTPDQYGVIYEDVELEASDGLKLHGWKLFAPAETRGTVLFFHGNAENISSHFRNVHWLSDYGYDVYLFDYHGYGQSQGVANLDAVINDAEAMIAYSAKQLLEDEKLIVIGHSLGGSIAIHAVAHSEYKHRIKALITVEAFSDYHEITQDVLAGNWLTWLFQWPLSFTVDNSYRPLNAISQITPVPLMLMHSKQDEIIPFKHVESLYEMAREPKELQVVVGGHNVIFNHSENRKMLLKYLSTLK